MPSHVVFSPLLRCAGIGAFLICEKRDFERAWPPPEGAAKLREQLVAIESRVRELFKPLHLTKKKDSKEEGAPARPPLPRGASAAGATRRSPRQAASSPRRLLMTRWLPNNKSRRLQCNRG
ncbi:PFP-BETA2 [Symbiodinium sp. CCMP2592]|nr:PFP-BETA2 [Symbiodinium sp. CCMP2592]